MSDEDELLLLSAAASAATIALAACSVKRRRKRAKRFWMRPLFQRRHERGAYNTLMSELRHMDIGGDARHMDIGGDATYSGFTRLNPEGFDFLLSLVNGVGSPALYSPNRTPRRTISRDSTKRCHWLQHFCLMNIFQHVGKPAIIAAYCMQKLHAIIAHETKSKIIVQPPMQELLPIACNNCA